MVQLTLLYKEESIFDLTVVATLVRASALTSVDVGVLFGLDDLTVYLRSGSKTFFPDDGGTFEVDDADETYTVKGIRKDGSIDTLVLAKMQFLTDNPQYSTAKKTKSVNPRV